jgi:hypothetical protein
MRRLLFVCAALALISGCNSVSPEDAGLHFDPAEAAYIMAQGKVTIEGQAFLRDKTGRRNARYAAGEVVRLVPATAYARARFAQYYGDSKFASAISFRRFEENPEYESYTRTTKAESTGRFAFDNVAPGTYFVVSQLTWRPKESIWTEGGAMYEEVAVTGNETAPVKVVLSGN